MKCLICNKEYKTLCGISHHIKIDAKTYYIEYMKNKKEICSCGKDCKFYGLGRGFLKTCGSKDCKQKMRKIARKTHPPVTELTKKKMSEWNKNKPPDSDETKIKKSESAKKAIRPPHKESTKKKIGDANAKSLRIFHNKIRMSNPLDKNYYLYIILNEKFIKIGITIDIKRRLKELNNKFFKKCILLDTYYGNYNEIYKLESELHNKYDKYNVILEKRIPGRTEWFKKEILEDIKKDFEIYKKEKKYA